jgi:glutathione S-transferase
MKEVIDIMRVLHHHELYASSRIIRLVMAERGIVCLPKSERPWDRVEEFLRLNPAGDVPVLMTEDGEAICGASVIAEYLEETEGKAPLIWGSASERAEIRRLTDWFEGKFMREVGAPLLNERFIKRFVDEGQPSSVVIRAAMTNLHIHLDYLDWLTEQDNWLAGRQMSLADLVGAAHLSVLDYFGDIDWDRHTETKNWYAKMKSRPSFRELLADQIPGLPAAAHYGNLDF